MVGNMTEIRSALTAVCDLLKWPPFLGLYPSTNFNVLTIYAFPYLKTEAEPATETKYYIASQTMDKVRRN